MQMHHQPEDKDNTKFGITKYSDFPNRYMKSQSPFDDFYRDSKFQSDRVNNNGYTQQFSQRITYERATGNNDTGITSINGSKDVLTAEDQPPS